MTRPTPVLTEQSFETHPISSEYVRKVFELTDDFHDAELTDIRCSDDDTLFIEIRRPRWIFLDIGTEIDYLTDFRMYLKSPSLAVNWGTDEEIKRSSIYNFFISTDGFKIDTGDGGRAGSFDIKKSTAQHITSMQVLNLIKGYSSLQQT